MLKTFLIAGAAAAALSTAAFAGELGSPPVAPRGTTTGYAVPTAQGGIPGVQSGGNWTSRSGNTNIGGYTRIEAPPTGRPNVEGGVGVQLHF